MTETVYTDMFKSMVLNPGVEERAKIAAEKLYVHRDRFISVKTKTGVPWMLTAALLYRESDGDLDTYLGNGDPLNRVTRDVPAGRGPFSSFEEGAIDALEYEGMTHQTVWGIENILYWAHRFNGIHNDYGMHSPYVWAGSNHYIKGLYVADHKFDPEKVDHRLGVAVIIEQLMLIDAEEMNKTYMKKSIEYYLNNYGPIIPMGTKITFIVGIYDKSRGSYPLTRVQPWYERLITWLKGWMS